MEKAIFTDRAAIRLHPEQANTWHWHAAPQWEVQAQEPSIEMRIRQGIRNTYGQ